MRENLEGGLRARCLRMVWSSSGDQGVPRGMVVVLCVELAKGERGEVEGRWKGRGEDPGIIPGWPTHAVRLVEV